MAPAVKFEDLLSLVGDKGRWQYVIFLFTWIEGCLIGFHHLSSIFLGYSPDHWCSPDSLSLPEHWTEEQVKNFTIPVKADGTFEQCEMYDVGAGGRVSDSFSSAMARRTSSRVPCQGYTYSTAMGNTIVSDWNLVCDRLSLLSTVQGSYMGGVFVGCIFWGWASDKYGRRPSVLIAAAIQIVTSIVAAFSVNYIMFVFFRFLIAFSVSGVFECGFVLVTEIVGPDLRAPFGILTQFPFGIGASLLPAIAYFLRDWNQLQLAISVPCVLLVTYYWFIPESPRWLITEGRVAEALVILKKGAKTNGNVLPSDSELTDMMEQMREGEVKEAEEQPALSVAEKVGLVFKEMVMLVKTPEMRKRTLNIFFSWLVVAMVYYGLSFNTKNIGGDIYVSTFISGFVEVVACVCIIPALARFGRVKCYAGTFITGGLCCLAVAVVLFAVGQGSLIPLIIALAMGGKFLISGTFALAYLYTAELFPTPVRNVAVGGASTFARIGSMSAPYIVDMLGKVNPGIPAIIFGVFSTLAGVFALWLPETLNKKLPETVADVEASAKKNRKSDCEMTGRAGDSAAGGPDVTKLED